MHHRPILTPDTSGINRLADDPDSDALIAGLTCGFHIRLSFTSISEVIANEDPLRRQHLLRVCRLLLSSGDCIDAQHEIIRKMVAHFEESLAFDWANVPVVFPDAQCEIARNEAFTDGLAQQEREELRILDKQFSGVYENAKPAFDRLFTSSAEKAPTSVFELVDRLQVPGGAFWTLAANLYARVGQQHPDEPLMRRFTRECDPFRSLMTALCAAQFDRCIRPQNIGPSLRAGRNDTFMATCLPYCHQFVTADSRQLACYRAVASAADLGVTLHSYHEFRNTLFVNEPLARSMA